MEVRLHSPPTTNLTTPFPVHKLNIRGKQPLLPSRTYHTNEFTTLSNSCKPNKDNSFLVSFSLSQQKSNEQFILSLLHSLTFSSTQFPLSKITTSATKTYAATPSSFVARSSNENVHWMVIMDKPYEGIQSKAEIVNYYVTTLQRALGSDARDAQRCIYDVSCHTHFGFCCIVDEEASGVLASLPGVLSVTPDPDIYSVNKDYSNTFNHEENSVSKTLNGRTLLFPNGWKHWLVHVEKPSTRVSSKAQIVDFYVNMLIRVLGNEKDAQMCLYHVSWQNNFGFCCILDEDSAQELGALPGVLSVEPDEHFGSKNKDSGGDRLSSDALDPTETDKSKTKLFITGLSFYTSEKTLRAAFEPFGELVEVKVIMDKISKRSKGYAFLEYTSEDVATAALQEMNGKIINGWMIVVDRAKSKPQIRRGRDRAMLS